MDSIRTIGFQLLSIFFFLTFGTLYGQPSATAEIPRLPIPSPPNDPQQQSSVVTADRANTEKEKPLLPPAQYATEPLNPPPGISVEEYIGHRAVDKNGSGWGWVKRPNEDWKDAHWVALKETPGGIVAPWRKLKKKTADDNFEYRMKGYITDYKVYDPHTNELLEVFVPEMIVPIGPAKPLAMKPGPPSRFSHIPEEWTTRRTSQ
ncbi:hypothetical protein [Methylacidiphilum caldifontis]|uniref:Uncharacterized protein n=1 Tax=Methylacidiphilum caldifontis TaxID=2795386 RepID=A0A4Y8PDG0_9BACT|nr:hypothetical protein [Methylacidiphilum caldifontis]QSR88005.1 hypothetical protein IT6_06270 [Methylacidiphilum caldifontis]TFE69543.1 hypothetical protein A7Q10_06725 [Methylacidiphilum caldifontis]